jgi:hypothetical protein
MASGVRLMLDIAAGRAWEKAPSNRQTPSTIPTFIVFVYIAEAVPWLPSGASDMTRWLLAGKNRA